MKSYDRKTPIYPSAEAYDEALEADRHVIRNTCHRYALHDCFGSYWNADKPPTIFEWVSPPNDGRPRAKVRIENPTPADRKRRGFNIDAEGVARAAFLERGRYILNSWRVHKVTGAIEVLPGARFRRSVIEQLASKHPSWNLMELLYPGPVMELIDDEDDGFKSSSDRWKQIREEYVDMVLMPEHQPCPDIDEGELPDGYDLDRGLTALPEWDEDKVPMRPVVIRKPQITPHLPPPSPPHVIDVPVLGPIPPVQNAVAPL